MKNNSNIDNVKYGQKSCYLRTGKDEKYLQHFINICHTKYRNFPSIPPTHSLIPIDIAICYNTKLSNLISHIVNVPTTQNKTKQLSITVSIGCVQ